MSLATISRTSTPACRPDRTLHGFFDAACRDPGLRRRVALRSGMREWRYEELDDRVRAAAAALARRGVCKGDVVAVAACRTFETLAAIHAVLSLGAAYLPIDKRAPAERVAYMAAVAGCRHVVTDEPAHYQACLARRQVVALDELAHAPAAASITVPVGAEDIAYVMFTSGTTGRPKAVPIRHGSAAGLIEWALERFTGEDLACVLASTSFSFDVSIFELFAPLAGGGSLFLVDSILSLADLPVGTRITLVNAVPSALGALLADYALPISAVRAFLLAGEALPPELARRLYGAGARRIHNLYGPTEDTVFSTEHRVDPLAEGPVPLGRPLPGHGVVVVDGELRPVPPEAVGEICLMGSGLSRGYLAQPDLTAQRYVPAPAGAAWPLMYRTGDLGRIDRDGLLHFHGRADHQVKLRGQRVELDEIARVIASVDGVAQAVVRVRSREGADGLQAQWLVAYVVARRGLADTARLRHAIDGMGLRLLPDYMRPDKLVFLDALPLNTSGKVDEHRLDRAADSAPHGLPATSARPQGWPASRPLPAGDDKPWGGPAFSSEPEMELTP